MEIGVAQRLQSPDMNDNMENMQPASQSTCSGASSGELPCLHNLLEKDKQSPFVDDKAEKRPSVGIGATCREVSGLQDLLTPFFTPQEGGGRR